MVTPVAFRIREAAERYLRHFGQCFFQYLFVVTEDGQEAVELTDLRQAHGRVQFRNTEIEAQVRMPVGSAVGATEVV